MTSLLKTTTIGMIERSLCTTNDDNHDENRREHGKYTKDTKEIMFNEQRHTSGIWKRDKSSGSVVCVDYIHGR